MKKRNCAEIPLTIALRAARRRMSAVPAGPLDRGFRNSTKGEAGFAVEDCPAKHSTLRNPSR
jgi:hypothetical protein